MQARIEDLADLGVDGPFDGILAAYLVRNLPDPDTAVEAFLELLPPGATLGVHEYSVRDSRPAMWTWNAVCWGIIIPSGWRHTRDTTLYRHLWRSVLTFDGAARFRHGSATPASSRCTARPWRLAAQHRSHIPRGRPR